jgi:putative endonuclease
LPLAHTRRLTAMAYLYILVCGDGSYYVGSTRNLENRMEQHDSGFGSAYTAKRQPVKLVFAQEFDRIDDAYTREKQVQGWSRAKRQALIEGRLNDLPRLSESRSGRSSTADFDGLNPPQ